MRLGKWMPFGCGFLLLAASCGKDDAAGGGAAGAGGQGGSAGTGGAAVGTSGSAGNTGGIVGGRGGTGGTSGNSGEGGGFAAGGGGRQSGSGGASLVGGSGLAGAPGGARAAGGSPQGGQAVPGGAGRGGAGVAGRSSNDVTVTPRRIDDVLINPGMGLANFHFGWMCNLPPIDFTAEECATRTRNSWPENHPDCGTAYFRWNWRELEPVQGEIDFALIDRAIESANALHETLGFRVMTIAEDSIGIPDWLRSRSAGQELPSAGGTTYWPDYRDATFQSEHARFVAELAQRYDGHPGVDSIDIGSVGCWGEWNTACLTDGAGLIGVYAPADAAAEQAVADALNRLIDAYTNSFHETPLVMLGIGDEGGPLSDVFVHAIQAGTGWRVDCWGDWGIWGDTWSHQADLYPNMISEATSRYSGFGTTWQHAPIQLEVCGTMPEWVDLGWTATAPDGEVYRTFQWALEQHTSVLNAKWTDIPAEYLDALGGLLRQNGYRFVIDQLSHPGALAPGAELRLASTWTNLGVAPIYLRRLLSYRLRGSERTVTFESSQDVRTWLPGAWSVNDLFTLPGDLPSGTYQLDVAILDRAGQNPTTEPLPPLGLGIEGRGADGWYALSQLTVE